MSGGVDDWQRIYGGSMQLDVMKDLTQIVRRLGPLITDRTESFHLTTTSTGIFRRGIDEIIGFNLHADILEDATAIFEQLRTEYDCVVGPLLSLKGPPNLSLEQHRIVTYSFKDFAALDGDLDLHSNFEFAGSAFAKAAFAYKREAGWDFAPGEAGVWILYCLPHGAWGTGTYMIYSTNLVGFLVVHDRNNDGNYESIAHMWTAQAARRKGVASALLNKAREFFPLTRVEGPLTESGAALIQSQWPEAIAKDKEEE